MITGITITGADDSVQYSDLLGLSKEYRDVEWGILVGRRERLGTPRYPSYEWMEGLTEVAGDMRMALHLCGGMCRDYIDGKLADDIMAILRSMRRVQLNIHNLSRLKQPEIEGMLSRSPKQHIFQYDPMNMLRVARAAGKGHLNVSVLYDGSGGRGIEIKTYIAPSQLLRCGYAGGLGPDNLERHMELINKVSGDVPVWIDMETGVRSEDDRVFDLDKVRKVLEIYKKNKLTIT